MRVEGGFQVAVSFAVFVAGEVELAFGVEAVAQFGAEAVGLRGAEERLGGVEVEAEVDFGFYFVDVLAAGSARPCEASG